MQELGDVELARKLWLKRVRAEVRWKHIEAAERELNEKLPLAEKLFDQAIQKGKAFELDTRSVLEGE